VCAAENENIGLVFGVAGLVSIAGFLLGFDLGLTSSALTWMTGAFGLSSTNEGLTGLLVSAIFWGALPGAVLAGTLASRMGRRRGIVLCAVLYGMGAAMVAVAQGYWVAFVGKVFFGMGIGISAVVVPMYVSEISPPRIRGTALFFFQAAISTGLLVSFGSFWLMGSGEYWRVMCGVEIGLAVTLGLGLLFAPDSPRMLMLFGREDAARNVLQRTLGRHNVQSELDAMRASLGQSGVRWAELLDRRHLGLVMVGVGLFFMQQVSGVAAVTCFAAQVFAAAGFVQEHDALFAATMLGVMTVASIIPGSLLIDRLGRRKLLLGGSALTVSCLLVLAVTYFGILPEQWNLRWIRLVSILAFVFCFTCSLGGVPWVMLGEIYPLRIRGVGMAMGSSANWGMNLVVTSTYLWLADMVGLGGAYLLYAAGTVVCMVIAYRHLPETKDRPLELLEANLYAGRPLRRLGERVP